MRKKKILVIDDDEMNLQIAKMILEKKLPCEVLGADNGVEGIEILKSRRVSLVLLDIMMPDFDGIETLQEIRGDEQIKNVPVMMLTASGDIEDIQKAGALGVKDYVKKPFMPADLIERVSKKLAEEHSEEILLVGEDETELLAMRDLIEKNFPHEALIATSTAAAEEILNRQDINLIIACADMKFINGFKFLAFLADEKFNKIPFALTTSDKILELIDKINQPEAEEPPEVKEVSAQIEESSVEEKITEEKSPAVEKPPIVEEIAESPIILSEKKKLANVVTTLIGYELDVKI